MYLSTEYPTKISIIILNYNGKKYVDKCLQSIKNQIYPDFEVFVVDNASTDDSVSYIQKKYPWVKILKNKTNLGYAGANNLGAKQALGKWILFLNMDTWAKHDLLLDLIGAVTKDSTIGACACMQLSYDGNHVLDCGMTIDVIGYPMVSLVNEPIFYSDGASFFIKKSIFLELDGFDAAYFMYGEDVDLCWRVWLAGYKVASVPSAVIGHKSSGTFVVPGQAYQMNVKRRYLAERNSLRSLLKNYSAASLVYILPLRLAVSFPKTLLFALIKPELVKIEFSALLWNYKNLKGTFAKRSKIQKDRCVSDRKIIGQMSGVLGIARSFSTIRQSSGLKWKEQ